MSKISNDIILMLKDKPEVKKSNDYWPTENGLYSLSGIKSYMRTKGYTNDMVDQSMHQPELLDLNHINVYNNHYREYVPYYYSDLSDIEITNIKKQYETKKS